MTEEYIVVEDETVVEILYGKLEPGEIGLLREQYGNDVSIYKRIA